MDWLEMLVVAMITMVGVFAAWTLFELYMDWWGR